MALSVSQSRGGPFWPLGFVQVSAIGTPVALSSVVDPTGLNNPNKVARGQFPLNQMEYTVSFRGIQLWGFKPAANNNGFVNNSGNVYLLAAAAGGAGNRSDSGVLVGVITPGNNFLYAPEGAALERISPYFLYLDADNNNDGAIAVGIGGSNP